MSTAPDYTAPILGIREWIVQGKYLRSTNQSEIWRPGEEKTATCRLKSYTVSFSYGISNPVETRIEPWQPPPGHNPPADECGCGLYAHYDRRASDMFGDGISKDYLSSGLLSSGVRGVVSAWGDVILCDYGFKAQHMKLEAIFLEEKTIEVFGSPVSISAAYRRLAERYGVPLILPAEFKAFSKEIGGVVLSLPKQRESTETVGRLMLSSTSLAPLQPPVYTVLPARPLAYMPALASGPLFGTSCNCAMCQPFARHQRQTTYKDWRDKTKDIRERRS